MPACALALIAVWPRPGVAFAMLIVLGVGYAWVEVAGLTLMQRLVSDEVLARVFGVVESTYVATTGLGGVLAPLAVALFGIEGALVAVGACLPLLALADAGRGSRASRPRTEVPERQFALLRSCSLFAPLSLATVENLAARLSRSRSRRGRQVIRQGDLGDRFYVVAEGRVDGRVRRRAARASRARASSSARSRCCATRRARRPSTRPSRGCCTRSSARTFVAA